ncbi:MAG: response regulator transcription factor [Burkholderiales bacterium]|nr:response regulator transcription factor [Burkholderiales bacterium]
MTTNTATISLINEKIAEILTEINHHQAYLREYINKRVGISINLTVPDAKIHFNPREYEILFLLYLGRSEIDIFEYTQKIYNKANINTISALKFNLYNKLKVKSNSELVDKAIKLNLIQSIPENFIISDSE